MKVGWLSLANVFQLWLVKGSDVLKEERIELKMLNKKIGLVRQWEMKENGK